MKIAIIDDGGSLQPRLHRAVLPAQVRISNVCSATTNPDGQKRVSNFAHLLGCPIDPITSSEDFCKFLRDETPDGIILTVSGESSVSLVSLMSAALKRGVNVCLSQPCPAFNQLPFEKVIRLYGLAKSTNSNLFATSRFSFSTAMSKIQNFTKGYEFGVGIIEDILFRSGFGLLPGDRFTTLSLMSVHAFHVIFTLIEELPQHLTVLEDDRPLLKSPSFTVSLKWSTGQIATIFLSTSRAWGVNYHLLEASGRSGAFIETDFLNWAMTLEGEKQMSILNDDDQSSLSDGSAARLKIFSDNTEMQKIAESQQKVILNTFWLRDALIHTLSMGKHAMSLPNLQRNLRRERDNPNPKHLIRIYAQSGYFKRALEIASQEIASQEL